MLFYVAALVLYYRLRQFSEPTGADGFFYLKQIQTLSESFSFYYHDYSFAFFVPAALNVVIRDPLLSYHITCVLVWAGIGHLCMIHTKNNKEPERKYYFGFMLAAMALFSINTLAIELGLVFLKTSLALFFFLLMWKFKEEKKIVPTIVFALLAILSHKTMVLFIPILIGPTVWPWLIQKKSRWGSVLAGFIVSCLVLYPRLIAQVKHLVNEGFFWEKFLIDNHPRQEFLVYLGLVTAGAVICALFKKLRHWPLVIILLLPLFSPGLLNTEGVAYRFLILGFPFLLIAMGRGIFEGGKERIASATLLVLTMGVTWHYRHPLSTWVNPWEKRISSTEKLTALLPERALLYAPHGLEFYLAWKTPLRPRSLRIEAGDRKVYRVAYVGPYLKRTETMLYQDIVQMRLLDMGTEFALFDEQDWLNLNAVHQFRPHPMNLLPKKPDFMPDYED